jgi:Zn-dependent protease with chaperone function
VDFFARQQAARRTTRWLVLAFFVSVACIVIAIDAVIAVAMGFTSRDLSPRGPVIVASVVVFAVICGASLFKTLALRSGGASVARSLGGTRVDRGTSDIALKRLYNIVEEMAIASGVTMPEIYVLEDEDGINAFAAGNSPADAAIAVTRGAATRLRREELQAVVAHEFSHVLNGDSRLYMRLLGLTFGLLAIATVARLALQFSPRGGRDDKKGGAAAIMLAALAIMALGYIGVFFGRLLQAAVSRHREKLADASAVQFTRNPQGLTGALLKIAGTQEGSHLHSPGAENVAHMLFAPGLDRLMRTHPTLEERLRELDRNFRVQDLPRLAQEAARDAERLRAADAAFGADAKQAAKNEDHDPFGALARPLGLALGTGGLTDQVGGLATEHLQYAATARLAIPPELREFPDSADHARALVLSLLVSRAPAVRERQHAILERAYGAPVADQVLASPHARALPAELRLPAVQQLFPVLRRLARAEREQLRDVVGELASADEHIDVFECCLSLTMAVSLGDELEAAEPHGDAMLLDEAASVRALFAILARHGSADAAEIDAAYTAGLSAALPGAAGKPAVIDAWPLALGNALERLTELQPIEKKRLIEGLVRCVAHDKKLSVEEGELLRTVCAVLNCPLPPLLGATG